MSKVSAVLVYPRECTYEALRKLQEQYEYVIITMEKEIYLNPDRFAPGLYWIHDGGVQRVRHRDFLFNNDLVRMIV